MERKGRMIDGTGNKKVTDKLNRRFYSVCHRKCFKSIYNFNSDRLRRFCRTVCGWSSFRRSHGCYVAPVNQRPSRLRAQFWNSTPVCGSRSEHACPYRRFIAIFAFTRGLCVQIYVEKCWELVHSLSFQNRASL